MVIYRDDNPEAARTICLSLSDGSIYMSEQDCGPLVERWTGRQSAERFLSRIDAEHLKRILKISSDSEMIESLARSFGTNHGFDDFVHFLNRYEIPFETGSY